MGWGSWSTPFWVCPGGMFGAEVGVVQDGPGALCTESALAGQLKLKWVHVAWWGRCPGPLSAEGTLAR